MTNNTGNDKNKEYPPKREESGDTDTTMGTTSTTSSVGTSSAQQQQQQEEKAEILSEENENENDSDLIQKAEEFYRNERLFRAAELLKNVQDKSLLTENHHMMLKWAQAAEIGMKNLLESPEKNDDNNNNNNYWKKQSESHGYRDFLVYYHVTKDSQLTCRIDSAIESSLLIPIIGVFNESELYKTWMPSYEKPIKLGIADTKKLKEAGRGNQIIQVTVNMAWPFATRETIQHAMAIDSIDEDGVLVVHVRSETPNDDPSCIPEPLPGVVRIDFECTILIGGCPDDHPCLAKSKHKYPTDEELILVSLSSMVDPHVMGVPVKLINLVTRTAFGRLWSSLLQVAEDVRDGKRPEHQEAIASKRELYDFVESRIGIMLDKVKNKQHQQKESSSEPEATTTD